MYEIPKINVPVELVLTNDDSIEGNMFITEDLLSAAGNPMIEEFLNDDPDQFFPFESKAGAYRLINKYQLIMVRSQQDDAEVKTQTPLPPRNLVLHLTNKRTVYGVIYPTLAEESRVSDLINEDEHFIVIYQNGQKLIVNRDQVVYVNAN